MRFPADRATTTTDPESHKMTKACAVFPVVLATIVAWLSLGAAAASAAPSLDVTIDNDANEVQRVVSGARTAGSFKLAFGSDVTPELPLDAPAEDVEAALNALPSISAGGGSVSVFFDGLSNLHFYLVTFDGGPLAHTDVPLLVATPGATPLSGASEKFIVETIDAVGVSPNDLRVDYIAEVSNTAPAGPNGTSGMVTVEVEMPAGASVLKFFDPVNKIDQSDFSPSTPVGWTCSSQPAVGPLPAKAICTRDDALAPDGSYPGIGVAANLSDGVAAHAVATATVSGGGSAPSTATDEFDLTAPVLFDILSFGTGALDSGGNDYTQAGGHPDSAFVNVKFPSRRVLNVTESTPREGKFDYSVVDHVKNVITDLPKGFAGNPLSIPELCPGIDQVLASSCPPGSVVGGVIIDINYYRTGISPLALYAIKPERGVVAQFAFAETSNTQSSYTLSARLDPQSDYGISIESAPVVGGVGFHGTPDVTLCSFGAKVRVGVQFFFDGCRERDDPEANAKPLVSLPPQCEAQPPTTTMSVDSWENPGVFKSRQSVDPALTGCDQVEFTPEIDLAPTSTVADSASGLDVDLRLPNDGLETADGLSQAHLKKTVVDLPEGIAVNPSAATGLKGCSDGQLALGTDDETSCPDGSKIGTVEATTPVLEEILDGDLVLRTPRSTDPQSGEMLRMALIVRNKERGILVKLPGSAVADPQTGRLTATFDNNPQLPIGTVDVDLKGGSRGVLAMPQSCGEKAIGSELSPWKGAANTNANAVSSTDSFAVGGDCSLGFAPKLTAGMSNAKARETGDFSFRFSREDGEQWVDGLTAKLPQGLLARVKDVPLCSSADAAAGGCPAGSKIGSVDAAAGSGTPFVLEQEGSAFLTEGYKGCAYGLSVKVPVVAGPFDGSSPETDLGNIVVRQALCVDPTTAEVSAVSDPFPTIWHGIPLRVRSVTVKVDRPGFMVNPSDCAAGQVAAMLHSVPGNTAGVSVPFQATGCSALSYKPRIGLRLTGKRQVTTGKHPGIRALVRQNGVGEAGIEQAVVRLPKSLALDPENAQALCEFVDGTKPDLEKRCPKGSIVGRAKATSPLLNKPLVGNVYFVKNVRIDPKTGNSIRTLPMIVVALRGEVAVNLKGESSTTKGGKLVNTFASVPDAPISQFNLNINGGQNGIIAVTRTRKAKINLCAGRHIAEADTDGQNGRRRDFDINMKTPCSKKQVKKAKRAAAKARA